MFKIIFLITSFFINGAANSVGLTWEQGKNSQQLFFDKTSINVVRQEKITSSIKHSKQNYTISNNATNIVESMVNIFGGCIPQKDINIEWICVDNFNIGSVEVTNDMYRQFNTSHNSNVGDFTNLNSGSQPVVNLSLMEINSYISWLNKNTKKKYRLPTIDEWEYSAIAGINTQINMCEYANLADINCTKTKSTNNVGAYRANNWGLYDMFGNVWEVVSTKSGAFNIKGGSWTDSIKMTSVDLNLKFNGKKSNNIGFRLVEVSK